MLLQGVKQLNRYQHIANMGLAFGKIETTYSNIPKRPEQLMRRTSLMHARPPHLHDPRAARDVRSISCPTAIRALKRFIDDQSETRTKHLVSQCSFRVIDSFLDFFEPLNVQAAARLDEIWIPVPTAFPSRIAGQRR